MGDCYLISSLGAIADSSPAAIQNMFVDNGDGTWTVRFYANGTADYVTVNSQLPVTSQGNLIFDGYGLNSQSASNVLWIELAEKAYAQWNQTGKEGRNGQNSYAAIEGGWMADVDAQVLGHAAASYNLTSSAQQTLIGAVTGHKAVTDRHHHEPQRKHGALWESRLRRDRLQQRQWHLHALQSLGNRSAGPVDLEPTPAKLRWFRGGRRLGHGSLRYVGKCQARSATDRCDGRADGPHRCVGLLIEHARRG